MATITAITCTIKVEVPEQAKAATGTADLLTCSSALGLHGGANRRAARMVSHLRNTAEDFPIRYGTLHFRFVSFPGLLFESFWLGSRQARCPQSCSATQIKRLFSLASGKRPGRPREVRTWTR